MDEAIAASEAAKQDAEPEAPAAEPSNPDRFQASEAAKRVMRRQASASTASAAA